MNISLAFVAGLGFYLVLDLVAYLPVTVVQWAGLNLRNAIIINVVLAIFNLFPVPPLDGGRIAVGLLPPALGNLLSRLEPYGMLILLTLFVALPLLGAQLGVNLGFVSAIISSTSNAVIVVILWLTGNT